MDIILPILHITALKYQKQQLAQGHLMNQDGSQGKMPNIQFPAWELFSQYRIPASGAVRSQGHYIPGAVRGNLTRLME